MPITRHRLHRCTEPDCTACNNRVPVCEVCQGIDTSLPTDCPGVPIPEALRLNIGRGLMNYREGLWRSENNMRGRDTLAPPRRAGTNDRQTIDGD